MATFAMKRLVGGAVGLALCLAVVGCGSSPGLTKGNYDRIKIDGTMTKEDVDKLMGSQGSELTAEAAKQLGGMMAKMAKGPGEMFKGAPDASKAQDAGKAFGELGDMAGKMGDMFGKMAQGFMGAKVYRWGDDNKYVACTLMNGKVISKQEKGL